MKDSMPSLEKFYVGYVKIQNYCNCCRIISPAFAGREVFHSVCSNSDIGAATDISDDEYDIEGPCDSVMTKKKSPGNTRENSSQPCSWNYGTHESPKSAPLTPVFGKKNVLDSPLKPVNAKCDSNASDCTIISPQRVADILKNNRSRHFSEAIFKSNDENFPLSQNMLFKSGSITCDSVFQKQNLNYHSSLTSEKNIKSLHNWDYSSNVNILHSRYAGGSSRRKSMTSERNEYPRTVSIPRRSEGRKPVLNSDDVSENIVTSSVGTEICNSNFIDVNTVECVSSTDVTPVNSNGNFNSNQILEESVDNVNDENFPVEKCTNVKAVSPLSNQLGTRKRKHSEESPRTKKLRSPSTPHRKSFKRISPVSQRNTIDKYFTPIKKGSASLYNVGKIPKLSESENQFRSDEIEAITGHSAHGSSIMKERQSHSEEFRNDLVESNTATASSCGKKLEFKNKCNKDLSPLKISDEKETICLSSDDESSENSSAHGSSNKLTVERPNSRDNNAEVSCNLTGELVTIHDSDSEPEIISLSDSESEIVVNSGDKSKISDCESGVTHEPETIHNSDSEPVIILNSDSEPESVHNFVDEQEIEKLSDCEIEIVQIFNNEQEVVKNSSSNQEAVHNFNDEQEVEDNSDSEPEIVQDFNNVQEVRKSCDSEPEIVQDFNNVQEVGKSSDSEPEIVQDFNNVQNIGKSSDSEPEIVHEFSGEQEVERNSVDESALAKTVPVIPSASDEPSEGDNPNESSAIKSNCHFMDSVIDLNSKDSKITSSEVVTSVENSSTIPDLDSRLNEPVNANEFETCENSSDLMSLKSDEKSVKSSGKKTESVEENMVTTDELITSYDAVLVNYHDKVASRMGLKWNSICSLNPYLCSSNHRKRNKPLEVCDARTQMADALLQAREWSSAFNFSCSITSEKNYPSAETILRILYFILDTHECKFIGRAVSVFKKMVALHPPCAPDMLKYYTRVLTGSLGKETPELTSNGIVEDTIHKLHELMQEDDFHSESVQSQSSNINLNSNSLPVHDSSVDEELDEQIEDNVNSEFEAEEHYSTLSKKEKFDRLFLLLELLIEVLEVDLSVILVKRSSELKWALTRRTNRPLTVSVVWRTSNSQGVGYLNNMCRHIIRIFVLCFDRKVQFRKQQIIARFLNLVVEVARACDINSDVEYPYFGDHCTGFAQLISQLLSDTKTEDIVKALGDMLPSFLTLHVTNSLLSSSVGYNTSPTLKTIINLVKKCCLSCEEHKETPASPVKEVHHTQGKNKSINKRNSKGETILHRVCRKNDIDKLKNLLEDPDTDVNIGDNFGWTPLHEAISHGSLECVEELLKYNLSGCRTNLHAQSNDGTTPLIDAAQNNQLEVCRLLLRHGGESLLIDKNKDGKNAFEVTSSPEIKALLKSVSSNESCRCVSSRVPLLLPVMLRSYFDTFQTLHVVNSIKNCRVGHSSEVKKNTHRKGWRKSTSEYLHFQKDYKDLKKLKIIVKDEKKRVPNNALLKKMLFLIQ